MEDTDRNFSFPHFVDASLGPSIDISVEKLPGQTSVAEYKTKVKGIREVDVTLIRVNQH